MQSHQKEILPLIGKAKQNLNNNKPKRSGEKYLVHSYSTVRNYNYKNLSTGILV